jgi:hypothetical protein
MEALINAILVLVFIILLMCMWRMVSKSCMKTEGFEVIDPRFRSTGNSIGYGISSRTISGEYQKMWNDRTGSLPNFHGSQ